MRKQQHKDKDGNIRRNPYRYQIDYIMVHKKHMIFVQNARSYGGINTESDHKIVITKMSIQWYKMKTTKFAPKINISKLREKEHQTECKRNLKKF